MQSECVAGYTRQQSYDCLHKLLFPTTTSLVKAELLSLWLVTHYNRIMTGYIIFKFQTMASLVKA